MTEKQKFSLIVQHYKEAQETKDIPRLKILGKGLKSLGYTRTQIQKAIDKLASDNE